MGVWISGFFGSGKSHFLKILSYLLKNRVVDGKTALEYFIEDRKVKDEMVLADMRLAANVSSDISLFNIDSKSGMADTQNNKEAILSVFLKVFNQHLGFYGANPFLADLERHLSDEVKYEDFKKVFAEIRGKDWEASRHQFRFIQDHVCKALVHIDYMSMDAAKNWCESSTGAYNIDVTTFAKMVKQYIDKKGNNHHVVFLVDEIGQYIGEDSKLMLNLQTVTEDLGSACGGKAWVVVTSQQDIDSVTKTKGNDFSKIQGRFDTRLSLSSANVDEVIRKRILEKTESGRQTLGFLYDEKDTIIKNIFRKVHIIEIQKIGCFNDNKAGGKDVKKLRAYAHAGLREREKLLMKEKIRKRQQYIPERLKKQLAQIPYHALTVVEAPSGFGKTTAVSDYIKENLAHDAHAYWHTCLGEPTVSMWNGICNLLKYVDSDVANQLNAVDILSTGVVPEIARHLQKLSCDCETYLVVDNYQILDSIAPKELLSAFSLMEGSPNLHMVVITQQLSLQQLTALRHSSAHIIGASDFLFDINSTARLFKLAGIRLSDENLKRVQSDTEGWVSALCLQIIFYQQNGCFTYNAGIEQLVEVAICEKLTQEEKDLLVSLSVLDSFSIPQARKMLGEKGLPKSFETLLTTNAFIRYYPENNVYIMHSILQGYLKKRFYQHLPKEFQMQLLCRAGASCVEMSDYVSAAHFFCEAGDYDAFLSFPLREDYLLRTGDWFLIEQIVKAIRSCPQDILCAHPEAILILSFQLFLFSQHELSRYLCKLVSQALDNPVNLDDLQVCRLKGEMEYLLSFSEYNDLEKMSARHKVAHALLGGVSKYRFALGNFGSVSVVYMYWRQSGELERAIELMDENLPRYRLLSGEHSVGSDNVMRAEWLLLKGEPDTAEILCHKTIYIAKSKDQICICLCAELVLARIAILRGDFDSYRTAVENICRYADSKPGRYTERAAKLCLGFLSLTLGETEDLAEWLYDLNTIGKILYPATVPYGQMLYGRLLLLRRRYSELYGISQPMIELTQEMHYLLPKVYHLLSLASAKTGEHRSVEAREFLHEALGLALSDHVYLPFAEYASLRPLLEEAKNFGFDRQKIDCILSLCVRHQAGVQAVSKVLQMEQSPLTPRERDVALLARDRLRVKEIANKLFVSESTVKSTLKSIYQKLEVTSKGQLADRIF